MLVSCDTMRRMEQKAMEAGLSGRLLMENAASAAFEVIASLSPAGAVVLCGRGNNAGDGFAVARRLFIAGFDCEIVCLAKEEELTNDARENLKTARFLGVPICTWTDFDKDVRGRILVDALFGIGISRPITGVYLEAVRFINESGARVVSLDIPSGISGDTGKVWGEAVHADITVTFGAAKLGLYSPLSLDYVGEVYKSDISIPAPCDNPHRLLKQADVVLPKISRAAHKGMCGRAAVCGGSVGMAGAVYMATRAAETAGAGLVTAVVPEALLPVMMERLVGAMCTTEIPAADAICVGCGMGRGEDARARLLDVLGRKTKTIVIDADGLYHLRPEDIVNAEAKLILTPHIGEMARLVGETTEYVTENRVRLAREFAVYNRVTLVLKGAHTVVAMPSGVTYTNTKGNGGMAKGGSGDILAGLITGLAASGAENPAACGVYIHGLAGDLAAEAVSKRAMHAETLLSYLPSAIKCMENAFLEKNTNVANPSHGRKYI